MEQKRMIGVMIILMMVAVIGIFGFSLQDKEERSDDIPDHYLAVFHGGSGEIAYSTYIYKIENGHANYGFQYINTTNTITSWGSSDWKVEITGRGEVTWTDEVFTVAKSHGAYQYVTLPNSDEIYSIEEFMEMFLMN